jgi:hypothetical protein
MKVFKASSAAPRSDRALPELDHEALLRRAFAVARQSREQGDHPFGAILAGPDGAILRGEQGNGFTSEGGDMAAHAERLLVTWASVPHMRRRVSRGLHAVHLGGAMCDVLGRDLLGRDRPRRLWPDRDEPQGDDRRA